MRYNYSKSGCAGIIYDGVNLSDIFVVEDVRVPVLPSITASTLSLPHRPGEYYCSEQLGTRTVTIRLRVDAESRCPLDVFRSWREVSPLVHKAEPKKLYLDEDLYVWAKLTGETEIEQSAYYGTVELSFTCFDPYFYGPVHSIPLVNGANAFSMACEAYPELELSAVSSTVKVLNEDTGDFVQVSVPDYYSGMKLVVDMEKQTCRTSTRYVAPDLLSDFFLLSGVARVRLIGASGTLRYQERRL